MGGMLGRRIGPATPVDFLAVSPSTIRRRAALDAFATTYDLTRWQLEERAICVIVIGTDAPDSGCHLGYRTRAAQGIADAVAMIQRRSETPACAIIRSHVAVAEDVRRLWASMADLPILVTGPAVDGYLQDPEHLGVIWSSNGAERLLMFAGSAVSRVHRMRERLARLATARGLSHYEGELAWRWALGQFRERQLMAVLGIGRSTLKERQRRVIEKSGAIDLQEVAAWVRAEES